VEIAILAVQVSRRHAVVRRSGEIIHLEDLGSSNGTFVDGQRIHEPVQLRHAAAISLGEDGPQLLYLALED
jgi:ABC transport system ATP-binding/permease protein